MAEVKLVAEPREGTGKGVARKLRAAGRVPGVLYGHGMDSTALSVDARDLYHVLHTGRRDQRPRRPGRRRVRAPDHPARRPTRSHPRALHPRRLPRRPARREAAPVDPGPHRRRVRRRQGRRRRRAPPVGARGRVPARATCPRRSTPTSPALEIGMSLRVSDLVAPKGATILTDPEESVVAVQQPQMAVELEEEEALAAAEARGRRGRGRRGRGRGGRGRRRRGRRLRRAVRGLDALAAMTWLVAGLGNPGEPYAKTRHNLGYRVVDELAAREGERFRKARFVGADVARDPRGDRTRPARQVPRVHERERSGDRLARSQARRRARPRDRGARRDRPALRRAPGEVRRLDGGPQRAAFAAAGAPNARLLPRSGSASAVRPGASRRRTGCSTRSPSARSPTWRSWSTTARMPSSR